MKASLISYSAVTAVVLGVFTLVSIPAAQNNPPRQASTPQLERERLAESKPTPRTADGHVDFNGFFNGFTPAEDVTAEAGALRTKEGNILWQMIGTNNAQEHVPPPSEYTNAAPYKPEYLEKVKKIAATAYGGTTALDPSLDCIPAGIPRGAVGTMQIVQTPKVIALLYEGGGGSNPTMSHRVIYMDGRGHPKDLETSVLGHSIGHWEGDTLVVDVAGLDDTTWLDGGQGHNNLTTIHSDQEHVIERWTRKGDQITYNAIVEDPVMFTRPWVITPKKIRLAIPSDYMQAVQCSHVDADGQNTKVHMIQETEKDKFLCGWCNVGALYGLEGEAAAKPTTGQDVPDSLKEGLKTKLQQTPPKP